MATNVRHVLGISGGKDSAALAIWLKDHYPQLPIEYYFCDTGKELEATYKLVTNLEIYLGRKITRLEAGLTSHKDPFDHFWKLYGGYLPSSNSRWCTKKLKLEPFEQFVGDDPVISYVGIREDEDREGYISTKPNIQSIFPFRKNIWSHEIIRYILDNKQMPGLIEGYHLLLGNELTWNLSYSLKTPVSPKFTQPEKLNTFLSEGIATFNKVVFSLLKESKYPLSLVNDFPLTQKEVGLVRDDVFKVLRDSGVGVPEYYEKVTFEVNGKQGEYSRSRSGCYFCFFQQKIEWVWLYEQHPEKFQQAMEYEKEGYTWMQDERLEELIQPERIIQIKEDQLKRNQKATNKKSPFLIDILEEEEGIGCAACFI